jgi:hypothetical protein
MFQSLRGRARLAGPPCQAQRDALARVIHPSRPGPDPHTASSRAGRQLRRLAAVVAAVAAGLLASAAGMPAAFARDIPPGPYGRIPRAPVSPTTGNAPPSDWQIALIIAIAVLAVAVVGVVLGRAQVGRRTATSPDLSQPAAASSPDSVSVSSQSTVPA